MRVRHCVVMAGLLWSTTALAEKTLRPVNLTLTVPEGWEVLSEHDGDFLHYESSEDSEPRTIDVTFTREAGTTCKAWQAPSHAKKVKATYWPKQARTPLYVEQTAGKVSATGCLANTPTGALVVDIETLSDNPTYAPSAIDIGMLGGALGAALAAATAPSPTKATPTTPTPPPTTPTKPPPTSGIGAAGIKGGTKVTIPQLDLALKLPAGGSWIVGARGESRLETDLRPAEPTGAKLSISVGALSARTCRDWRVDMSTSDVATFNAHPSYLPKAAAIGAFEYTSSNGFETSTCLDTALGPLGLSIELTRSLEDADRAIVRSMIDAIAAGSTKYTRPSLAGSATVDSGSRADVSIGTITLPKGADWRITNGTVERFDKGHYFSLTSMSRSTPCKVTTAKPQPFLPDALSATVDTKPTGATVVRICTQTTHTIELVLAYDGAIDKADYALLKALVAAFIPKKATAKS